MQVKPNPSIVEIVQDYRRQFEKDATKADRALLENSRTLLYDELEETSWN